MGRTFCQVCSGFFQDTLKRPSCLYRNPYLTSVALPVLPFGIIEKDEHTGAFIILKTLIVMAVGIANQVIKDGCVDDIQEARAGVVRGRLFHGVTVALIILPPGGKRGHQGYLPRAITVPIFSA